MLPEEKVTMFDEKVLKKNEKEMHPIVPLEEMYVGDFFRYNTTIYMILPKEGAHVFDDSVRAMSLTNIYQTETFSKKQMVIPLKTQMTFEYFDYDKDEEIGHDPALFEDTPEEE